MLGYTRLFMHFTVSAGSRVKSNDFEVRKKEDGVQSKRQYRSNKADSSDSESDRGRDRHSRRVSSSISHFDCI